MGQLLSSGRELVLRSELIEDLRTGTLDEVKECRQAFVDLQEDLALEFEDFDEIFGLLVGDTEEVFEIFADSVERKVDALEVFSAAYLICDARQEHKEVEAKLEALFQVFDFDGSGALSQAELLMMFRASALAISKLAVGLEPPSLRELRQRAGDLFQRMDADASGALSLSELVQWTASQDELVLLLSRVCGAPFLGSYTKAYEELRERWLSAFQAQTIALPEGGGPDKSNPWCRVEDLAHMLGEHSVAALTASEAQQVADLVADCTSFCAEGYVDLETFREASQPLAAFEVVDSDRGGTLDVQECRLLFWLMEGEEPDLARVKRSQEDMDTDRSGAVSRLEWLRFNVVQRDRDRPGSRQGRVTLDGRVKRLFNEVDRDGNGIVSANEMLELMRVVLGLRNSPGISAEASRAAIDAASGGGDGSLFLPLTAPPQYSALVESMADDLAHALTDEFDESGDGFIEWREFAAHINDLRSKVRAFRAYVRTLG